MRLIDSHCHLDDKRFDADRDAVIERALAAGVTHMMSIGAGDGPPDLEPAIRLAEQHPCVYATVGVHPHNASKAASGTYARLAELAQHPKVLAIGEMGLDYHYDFSPRDVQRAVFRRQLQLAAETAKPIVIHTREAWEDTMAILREALPAAGIFHCFSGGVEQARQALELGFYLSFGGVLTFAKADELRDAARYAPLDRILIETDAPYLAPVPHRGKRNEPAMVAATLARLAEVRGEPAECVAEATTANFERLCLRA
ncbi:MAG: TatD family hydrolase [Bryobacteraceae bacterium]